jgi:hypothetical protein
MTTTCGPTRSNVLAEIESLDPERDFSRISYLSICFDFPWDVTSALDLALLKGSCVPSISGLHARTGEFLERAQKRHDDTLLILAELLESGYDSDRGRAAQRQMNRMHGRFRIANDDHLYILSTSVVEPIRFNARFGWRPYSETEKRAYHNLWVAIGRRMGIAEIPPALADLERFHDDYERERFAFSESNRANALAMIGMFSGWYPAPVRGAGRAHPALGAGRRPRPPREQQLKWTTLPAAWDELSRADVELTVDPLPAAP